MDIIVKNLLNLSLMVVFASTEYYEDLTRSVGHSLGGDAIVMSSWHRRSASILAAHILARKTKHYIIVFLFLPT